MRLAPFARILFVTPAYEFCSCMSVGMPMLAAIFSVGPLAYPPTPTATCGANSLMTFLAMRWLLKIFHNTLMFFSRFLRSKPAMGSPTISYPASGTLCISILLSAPTNRILASGCFALMASAIDRAGKMCPPVPPPLMIILYSFFMITKFAVLYNLWFCCRFFVLCACVSAYAQDEAYVYAVYEERCSTLAHEWQWLSGHKVAD